MKEYGTENGLQNQVESYNKKCKDSCALMGISSWGALLVTVASLDEEGVPTEAQWGALLHRFLQKYVRRTAQFFPS